MANPEIKVRISADTTDLFAGLNNVTKAVQKSSDEMGSAFGKLTGAFAGLQNMILGIGAVLGGGKLFSEAINATIEFNKEVGALTRTLGTTTKESATLAIAIGDIYGDTGAFLAGAAKMTKTLNANEQAIKNMGVETRKSNGEYRDTPSLIADINVKLGQYKEGTDRNIEAQRVYGKSYQEMLKFIKLTPEVMAEAKKKTEELGLALDTNGKNKLSAYRAAMNDVGDVLLGVKNAISLEVMPELTKLANSFISSGPSLINTLAASLRTLIQALESTTLKVGLGLIVLSYYKDSLLGLLPAVKNLAVGMIAGLGQAFLGIQGPATAATAAIKANTAALLANPLLWAAVAIMATVAAMEALASPVGKAADETAKLNEQMNLSSTDLDELKGNTQKYLDVIESGNSTHEQRAEATKTMREQLTKLSTEYPGIIKQTDIDTLSKKRLLEIEVQLSAKRLADYRAQKVNLEGMISLEKARLEGLLRTSLINQKTLFYFDIKNAQQALAQYNATLKTVNDNLKELEAKGTKKKAETDDKETALSKVKKGLEKEKYEYEKAAYDKGQLLEFTKAQEVAYLEKSLARFKGVPKERLELEMMILAAKRAVMSEGHALEMQDLKSSMEAFKNNAEERMRVARGLEVKAKNPKEAQDARDLQKKITAEIKLDQEKADAEIAKSKVDHNLAMIDYDLSYYQKLEQEGQISKLDLLKIQDDLEEQKYQIALRGFQDRLDLLVKEGNTTKEAQEKINAEIIKAKDARANQKGLNVVAQATETQTTPEAVTAELTRLQNSALTTAQLVGGAVKGVFSSLAGTMSAAFTGMLTGQMTFANGLKSIYKGLGATVAGEVSKMIAAKMAEWVIDKAMYAWKLATVPGFAAAEAAKQAAATGTAVTETIAANSSMGPWGWAIGIAAALALVAFISSMGANTGGGSESVPQAASAYSDRGTGLQFTGRAIGGLVTKPELTLLGESGPEVVAPLQGFQQYSLDLMKNSLNSFQNFVASGESAVGGFFGAQARGLNQPALAGGVSLHISGGFFGTDAEKEIHHMLQAYARRNY